MKMHAYLNIRQVVPLDSGNATALIETHLPHSGKVGEKVAHALAVAYIPHLEGTVGTGNDLLTVMLKAGDGTSVCRKGSLASARLWIPDAEGAVRSCRDKAVVAKV